MSGTNIGIFDFNEGGLRIFNEIPNDNPISYEFQPTFTVTSDLSEPYSYLLFRENVNSSLLEVGYIDITEINLELRPTLSGPQDLDSFAFADPNDTTPCKTNIYYKVKRIFQPLGDYEDVYTCEYSISREFRNNFIINTDFTRVTTGTFDSNLETVESFEDPITAESVVDSFWSDAQSDYDESLARWEQYESFKRLPSQTTSPNDLQSIVSFTTEDVGNYDPELFVGGYSGRRQTLVRASFIANVDFFSDTNNPAFDREQSRWATPYIFRYKFVSYAYDFSDYADLDAQPDQGYINYRDRVIGQQFTIDRYKVKKSRGYDIQKFNQIDLSESLQDPVSISDLYSDNYGTFNPDNDLQDSLNIPVFSTNSVFGSQMMKRFTESSFEFKNRVFAFQLKSCSSAKLKFTIQVKVYDRSNSATLSESTISGEFETGSDGLTQWIIPSVDLPAVALDDSAPYSNSLYKVYLKVESENSQGGFDLVEEQGDPLLSIGETNNKIESNSLTCDGRTGWTIKVKSRFGEKYGFDSFDGSETNYLRKNVSGTLQTFPDTETSCQQQYINDSYTATYSGFKLYDIDSFRYGKTGSYFTTEMDAPLFSVAGSSHKLGIEAPISFYIDDEIASPSFRNREGFYGELLNQVYGRAGFGVVWTNNSATNRTYSFTNSDTFLERFPINGGFRGIKGSANGVQPLTFQSVTSMNFTISSEENPGSFNTARFISDAQVLPEVPIDESFIFHNPRLPVLNF